MRSDVNVNIVTFPFKGAEASLTAMRPSIPLIVFASLKLDIRMFCLLLFTSLEHSSWVLYYFHENLFALKITFYK